INLLPLLAGKIASGYPGTTLAFTEYNYGAGQHISGGIAQADVLGIFGRDGVFAATQWQLYANEAFVAGAFRMYRNFDGQNGGFGHASVSAQTGDIAAPSVYASLDSANPKRMVLVVINKTANPITAVINLSNAPAFDRAAIYQLTGASAVPAAMGNMVLNNPAQLSYDMPAYSVSTLNLYVAAPPLTLQLSQSGNMAASGDQGGPFSPNQFSYQLSASSGSLGYAITGTPSWLTANSTAGTATTSPTAITFTINAAVAGTLAPGTYGPV